MVSNGNCVEPASRDLEIAPTRVGISVRLETAPTGKEQFQAALSIHTVDYGIGNGFGVVSMLLCPASPRSRMAFQRFTESAPVGLTQGGT